MKMKNLEVKYVVRIKITGDTHGEQRRMLDYIDAHKKSPDFDMLLICGDFGYIFRGDRGENSFLNYIEKEADFDIVFVDGNHENFPEIYSYPIEKWNGGLVHTIRKNIRHLMRGEIYTFGSKTFFTFGGGYSIDKEFRLRHEELYNRKVWWKEEFPTQEEINHAFSNLESHNWKVNYIITHSAPTNILPLVSEFFISSAKADVDIVNSTLETIRQKTVFDHWFFGHYHGNKEIDDKFTILYEISRNIEV